MFRKNTTSDQEQPERIERVTSVLGSGIIWKGKLTGKGGVRIEGTFEGEIAIQGLVVVGETGKVTCENVRANTVIVAGGVNGSITANKLEIRKTGRVWGNVIISAFSTEEGGFLRGQITMQDKVDLGLQHIDDELSESTEEISVDPPSLKIPFITFFANYESKNQEGMKGMVVNKYLVPMSRPDINEDDRQTVLETLQTDYLSIGPKIQAFEQSFLDYTGAAHAIGVNSGTAGLHLCVRAVDISEGDLVITTPFSFVSSTNVILFEHAIPIFVDVDPKTGNINPLSVSQAATDILTNDPKKIRKWVPRKNRGKVGSLKAILPVDVFGQPADYDLLQKTAEYHGLVLIEDSCEALGSEYKHKKTGLFGNIGVFAFYPNKQITTGEGGLVITDDDGYANILRALRNQGRAPGDTWLQHTYLGYNYRMDELSAALGVSQMKRINTLLGKRRQVANWYNTKLDEINGVEKPFISPNTTKMSWFVYVIRLSDKYNRDKIAEKLDIAGIPVRPYFLPIHLQPYMVDLFGYHPGDYPVTEDLGRRSLALPFSGKMTESQVDLVCRELSKSLRD